MASRRPTADPPSASIIPATPAWIDRLIAGETPTAAAGEAAGVLSYLLSQLTRAAPPWLGALRTRLSLEAAQKILARLQRPTAAESLRDSIHFRFGASAGPAGEIAMAIERCYEQGPERYAEAAAALFISVDLPPLDALPGIEARHRFAGVLTLRDELADISEAPFVDCIADLGAARLLDWANALPLFTLTPAGPLEPLVALSWTMKRTLREARRTETAYQRLIKALDNRRAASNSATLALFGGHESASFHDLPLSPSAARALLDDLVKAGALTELSGRANSRLYGLCP